VTTTEIEIPQCDLETTAAPIQNATNPIEHNTTKPLTKMADFLVFASSAFVGSSCSLMSLRDSLIMHDRGSRTDTSGGPQRVRVARPTADRGRIPSNFNPLLTERLQEYSRWKNGPVNKQIHAREAS